MSQKRKEGEGMLNLGVIEDTKSGEKWADELQNDLYDVVEVNRKDQLAHLDGVVIPMEKTEQLSQVIDWIIACRINPTAFIWVFSEVPLETEKKIMMSVGATDVISLPETSTYLSMSVENTFVRLENKYKEKDQKQQGVCQTLQLNEVNQSAIVNDVEKELTRLEYKLFSLLHQNPNTAVTYNQIVETLWPGKEAGTTRIANIICHIRTKIGQSEAYSITTVRSNGYMLRVKGE